MPFDPTLPVNNSLVSSSELRKQFTGLNELIDNVQNQLISEMANTAMNPAVNVLSQSISNPPTQAQCKRFKTS